jgi:hypothetical protein
MIGGVTLNNAPAMSSGDQIGMYCAYVPTSDGKIWGAVSYIFCPAGDVPSSINLMIEPTQAASAPGTTIEWITENLSATNGPPGEVIPVFSGSKDSITPVTFGGAMGYDQSAGIRLTTPSTVPPSDADTMFDLFTQFVVLLFVPDGLPGDPANGFTILWENSDGQPTNAASVTLGVNTVSFLYTGPS